MTASTRPRVKVVVPDRFRSQTAAVEDDAPEAPVEEEMAAPSPYLGWEGTLVLEGVPTGDGRLMEKGSLRWENLPLPLRWVEKDEGEHKNAVTVGRILEVWRDGQSIMGRGDLDLRIPEAVTLAGLMEDTDGSGPTVSGVSVDLDDVDIEVRVAEDVIAREEAMFADEVEGEVPEREVDAEGRVKVFEFRSDDELMVTVDARIRAATVVAIPAFIDARLALTGPTEEAEGEPLVASAGRRRPPAAWFENPRFGANPRNDPRLVEDEHLGVVACPLTVTDDGQVFGHIAAWRSCHTAFANECVSPPQSATSYRYFHVGALQVDDGRELPVGRLTVDTLHAGRRLSAVDTLAHYEHTGLAVADVVAGEDQHGIWVAGSLRSGVSDEQVARLKASPPSGDWRRIGGNLELVAVLAVNTPGFPVPRALVASGEVRTLQLPGVSRRESPLAELTDDELSVLKRMAVREAAASQERRDAAEGARRRMLVASAASRIRGAS